MITNLGIPTTRDHDEGLRHGERRAPLLFAMILFMVTAMLAASMTPTRAHASAFPGKNGRIVFISERTKGAGVDNPGGDREVFTMNPDGTGLKQLTHNTAEDGVPSYSSDGKKIVFRRQVSDGNLEIFVMNADGTGQKNLTNKSANEDNPSFSPSGKKILFDSKRNSNQDIFVMNTDGSGQKRLTTDTNTDTNATFSPDGGEIAFERLQFGSPDIFVMRPDGSLQIPLTESDARDEDPTFSPDGNRIAFASNRDGGTNIDDYDVFTMSADGSTAPNRLTNSVATEDEPAFSPDGKKIAYTSNRDGGDEDVFVVDSVIGDAAQTNITSTFGAFDFTPDWQPLPGDFTVTSASDPGDGVCDADCTLSEAITASNGIAGSRMNNIRFDIPGTGVHTITPQSPLPRITRPVTIDGYTQPGSSPNTLAKGTNAVLEIELNGTDATPEAGESPNGLFIDSSNVVVRGLVVNRFLDQGINVGFDDLTNVTLAGNFVGTDASGTKALGNRGDGIEMDASNSVVGGTTPAARNLISGNGVEGISVSGFGNKVRIEGNLVGTRADGVGALGNGVNGVDVAGGSIGVRLLGNAIFSNGQLGIDLGVNGRTLNDPGDTDTGANNLQNFPVLASARKSSGKTTIRGRLNSTPDKTFTVQFFSNPPGTDEGKTFIGQKVVTTDGSGTVSFTFSPAGTVALGQAITATATGARSTSEFSAPRSVTAS